MNKKLLAVVIFALLAAGLAGSFYYFKQKKFSTQTETKSQNISKVTELPTGQLAVGFPSTLPQEAGAKVLQNYQAEAKDGRIQSTRIITTKKTAEQVVKIYEDYFTKRGWKTANKNISEASAILQLTKENDLASVFFKKDPSGASVELTLTQTPPAKK